MASEKLILKSLDIGSNKMKINKKSGPMKRNDIGKRARIYHPYSSSHPWKSISEEITKHFSEAQFDLSSNADQFRDSFHGHFIAPIKPSKSSEVELKRHRRPAAPLLTYKQNQSLKRTWMRSRSPTIKCRLPSRNHFQGDELNVDLVKKNIDNLKNARLYLLRQNSQNVFTVASEDANKNSFKVTIGPQKCTCQSLQTHCIHLLFVMIRVLNVPENDPSILNKTLKKIEVESLVENYEKRRKSRLKDRKMTSPDSTTDDKLEFDVKSIIENEDDLCTICINPLKNEEILIKCENGCKNTFHQHCIDILSLECKNEKKSIDCPLCRRVWCENKKFNFRTPKNPVQNQAISSSLPEPHFKASPMKNVSKSSSICTLYRDKAQQKHNQTWIEIFGAQSIAGLESSDWSIRENKLKSIIDEAGMLMNQLINNSNIFNLTQSNNWIKLVTSFVTILQSMAVDPVHRVYVTSLEGLCTLLTNYACFTEDDARTLQDLIRPIVGIVLTKCADGVSRTSKTSLDFITNLSNGQSGNIVVGSETQCPARDDVTGILYVLSCIFESDTESNFNNWQRSLGRLYALDELMEIYPETFYLVQVCNKENYGPNWLKTPQTKLLNHDRITSVLGFALKYLKNNHANIRKMAERLFVRATRLSTHVPKVYNRAKLMLSKVDPSLLSRLRDRTPSRDRREDVELVSFSSVHFPNRRQSLGRSSLPSSPVASMFQTRRSSIPTFSTKQEQTFRTKPQRPNFLPLNNRRCSDGMIGGTDCCFNHICHVHTPCDRKCKPKRRKISPTVPPNTPMCVVGDLIDLSVPLLDAIPEIQSAKNMALKFASHKSMDDPRILMQSLSNIITRRQNYVEGIDWFVDKVLGNGGFSRCVLGRDVESGIYMAVKQVSYGTYDTIEKSREIIRDEIRIMTKLDHPNIMQLLAAHERDDGYDLFVEWMPGGSVADNLYKFGPFSDRIIVKYLWHLLCGLEYLHDNGILHRDLKGANLLIDSTGQHLRIADFGAAKRLVSNTTLPGEFRGDMKGTTAFMAPEVLRGECYGRSCDVWSVGCCVIEMVTTRPPWNVEEITNENALFYRIAASVEPPPIPETMTEIIKDFALNCLQPIKTNRPSVKWLMTHACFVE